MKLPLKIAFQLVIVCTLVSGESSQSQQRDLQIGMFRARPSLNPLLPTIKNHLSAALGIYPQIMEANPGLGGSSFLFELFRFFLAGPTVEFKVEAQACAEHAVKNLRRRCGWPSTLVLCEHKKGACVPPKWRREKDGLDVHFDPERCRRQLAQIDNN